ncbi:MULTISPECIES: hypothetical protein [unclassified Streptomyces]|uniref:hypothetical protein n=1 Tax=unclassified Streptomyces TaxID=2593676 RepID=UPI00109E654F|nr:hypothetical protein [Streptomyces sp. A1136]THA46057.1 hypothetical protein E6R62_34865 [Streptomyces sp. A1136]
MFFFDLKGASANAPYPAEHSTVKPKELAGGHVRWAVGKQDGMNTIMSSGSLPPAGDGRPDLPGWGQVVLLIVWATGLVVVLLKLRAKHRRR